MTIQILTLCVAVISPVITAALAYYFSVSQKHRLDNEEAAYMNYYGPLLTLLSHYQLSTFWYGAIRGSIYAHSKFPNYPVDNRLHDLIRNNIKYLPKDIGPVLYSFLMSSDSFYYLNNDEKYEHYAIEASNSFDFIIRTSLIEANKSAKKLGYPLIANELLNEFEKSIVKYPNNRHYLHIQ